MLTKIKNWHANWRTNRRLKKALKKEQAAKADAKAGNKGKTKLSQRKTSTNTPTHFDNAVLEWHAPQYIQYHKGPVWFTIFTLLIAAIGLYAIFTKDYFFALAMITFGIVYALTHRKKPAIIKVKLSHYGIKIGDQIYPYSQIKAFWVIYNPPLVETLNIRLDKKIMPDVTIFASQQNPSEIREFLSGYVPEWQNRQETFSETLIRLLRL